MNSINMTRSIAVQTETDNDLSDVVGAAIGAIASHAPMPDGWRATHPLDDSRIPADLWIHDKARVWIKRDEHEPWDPIMGRCQWCGQPHVGPAVTYTVMRPEDY